MNLTPRQIKIEPQEKDDRFDKIIFYGYPYQIQGEAKLPVTTKNYSILKEYADIYVVVCVVAREGFRYGMGISVRSPEDRPIVTVGMQIAENRAKRAALGRGECTPRIHRVRNKSALGILRATRVTLPSMSRRRYPSELSEWEKQMLGV